jgi:hypothetical protein
VPTDRYVGGYGAAVGLMREWEARVRLLNAAIEVGRAPRPVTVAGARAAFMGRPVSDASIAELEADLERVLPGERLVVPPPADPERVVAPVAPRTDAWAFIERAGAALGWEGIVGLAGFLCLIGVTVR